MPTKYYKFSGTVKWAKIRADQLDTKFNDDGEWKTDFYPDDPEAFKSTGIQTQAREDSDGVFFKLRRPKFLSFRNKETGKKEEVIFEPATVRLKTLDGVIDYPTGYLGNGTRVILNLVIFDTKKGKGHRFEEFLVTNLVEFDPDNKPFAANPVSNDTDLDDEIPF